MVHNFDQPGGQDLTPEADWQRGRAEGKPLREIGLHWAGGMFDARRLFNYFENAEFNEKGVIIHDPRNVSSHGCIELDRDGVVHVYQWIDLIHRTWHGCNNYHATGWDILVDPREKYLAKQQARGWDVRMRDNTTGRGPRRCVSMDPRMSRGVRQFTVDHLAVCDLGELLIPLGSDGMQLAGDPFNGVIDMNTDKKSRFYKRSDAMREGRVPANVFAHSHYSKNKSDPACYFEDMFPEFYQRGGA